MKQKELRKWKEEKGKNKQREGRQIKETRQKERRNRCIDR